MRNDNVLKEDKQTSWAPNDMIRRTARFNR